MSKNAMAGAVTLCGVGLCMIGGALLMQGGQQAQAAAGSMPAAAAVAATANAQAGPTVVWMGVTYTGTGGRDTYHRLWSDGRMQSRAVFRNWSASFGVCTYQDVCSTDWIDVPPPPGGNGIACRTDLNGDGVIGSADLTLLLNEWGQTAECEATYPCLDLGNLAGGVAMK